MDHAALAGEFTANDSRAHWHDGALWFVRQKRDKAVNTIPEWEALRELGSKIKMHALSRLPEYLEQFEREATKRGAVVHWAADDREHNEIVLSIIRKHRATKIVKSKSMLTEECHLNPFLEHHGVEVVDTDLGERIVQLIGEPPSHIVMPAIHIKKEEIGELFHEHLGTQKGASDPKYLAEAARQHLREKFMKAEIGLTGVNFAIAETGGFVVCTNEGNADLGVSLPRVHIACMGIEKIIPKAADLGVFLRLLARSATGQPITTYSSHFHGPVPGGELHIIVVDNGRSKIRSQEEFRRSLNCIRCGACMNTCPVYRRSGGHSYETTVPGPIGSILAPARDPEVFHTLPFACSLCGSCTDVCPVKINLHEQLLMWRTKLAAGGHIEPEKRLGMQVMSWVMQRPRLFNFLGGWGKWLLNRLPRWAVYHSLNPWGKQREMPPTPAKSFRQLYQLRAAEKKRSTQSRPSLPIVELPAPASAPTPPRSQPSASGAKPGEGTKA